MGNKSFPNRFGKSRSFGMITEEMDSHQELLQQRLLHTKWVFQICLVYNLLLTTVWLFFTITGMDGGLFVGQNDPITLERIAGFTIFFTFFWMIWSYAFHWLKYGLLKRMGLNRDELRLVFGNRLTGFDLEAILQRHSERSIRIIDMIGRRGRTLLIVLIGFAFIYVSVKQNPSPEAMAFGLQSSMFDALVMNWWILLTYRNNGIWGHMAYGAQARVLDGIQGRANALCIGTLWSGFKFVMIPIGLQLAVLYPPSTYAALYAFIWLSYAAADFASEIFGSIWGRHGIRVWGLGDMNRKSWAGFWSAFICTLVLNLAIVYSNQLSLSWLILGVLLAILNPVVELYSPRGTDDFTMATSNALVCWLFGWLAMGF